MQAAALLFRLLSEDAPALFEAEYTALLSAGSESLLTGIAWNHAVGGSTAMRGYRRQYQAERRDKCDYQNLLHCALLLVRLLLKYARDSRHGYTGHLIPRNSTEAVF